MVREPVQSRLIRSVGFDPAGSVLEVELAPSGRVYRYHDVPFSVAAELMAAESKGAYFNEHVRDLYAFEEVDEGPSPRVDRARRYHRAIRAILLESWDPLAIGGMPGAEAEYDRFVPALFARLSRGASRDDLAAHLLRLEVDDMGLLPDDARAGAVADRLLEARDAIEAGGG